MKFGPDFLKKFEQVEQTIKRSEKLPAIPRKDKMLRNSLVILAFIIQRTPSAALIFFSVSMFFCRPLTFFSMSLIVVPS